MAFILHSSRKGQGPPLVLLHGVAGSLSIWDPMVEELEKHFDVIRVDLLGYGYSDKPKDSKYLIADHLGAIEDTLRQLKFPKPFYIAGLSMGSLLALNYATKNPQDVIRIVAIGAPFYRDSIEARKYLRRNMWIRIAIDWHLTGPIIIPAAFYLARKYKKIRDRFSTKLYTEKMAQEALLNTYRAFHYTILSCLLNNPAPFLVEMNFSKDILFIHGSDDEWCPPQLLRDGLVGYGNTSIEILEGIGHNTVVLEPAKTAELMIDFLKPNN